MDITKSKDKAKSTSTHALSHGGDIWCLLQAGMIYMNDVKNRIKIEFNTGKLKIHDTGWCDQSKPHPVLWIIM